MKKAICLVTAVCLLVLSCYTGAVNADTTPQKTKLLLSEMSKQDLYLYLLENGVHFPTDSLPRENSEDMTSIFRYVRALEEDPQTPNGFNYREAALQFEEIRTAVIRYYGWENRNLDLLRGLRYTLIYSTVLDDTENPQQNCYGYALNLADEWLLPGQLSNGSYDYTAGVDAMAIQVKNDLKTGLSYNCVRILTTIPGSTSGWVATIAARKEINTDPYSFHDCHFARWLGFGWGHKVADTAILKFINAPSNNVAWTNERYSNGVAYAPTVSYNSTLRFIQYKASHSSTYSEYTGENYHAGSYHYWRLANKCSACDEILSYTWQKIPCAGPPCFPPFDDGARGRTR